MKLRLTQRARREIDRHDAWWRANRSAAPTLFADELASTVEHALANPHAGKRYRSKRHAQVLYLVMQRTERNLYYVVEGDELIVLGVWGARREHGPNV